LIFKYLDTAIWLASFLTEIVVIGLLFYRHVWRTLPFFCSYCVWDLVSNLTLKGIQHFTPTIYFHALFIDEILDSALLFCVLVELAWSVLSPLRHSLSRSSLVIVALIILVAGAAIWPFAALPGLNHVTSQEALLFAQLERTAAILRILFFLVLAGGSQLLSIGWRDRELQVVTGFGLFSIIGLTVAVMQTHQATVLQYNELELAETGGYLACLFYWAFSFAQQEATRREFTPQMQRFLLAVAGAARSARVGIEDTTGVKPRNPSEK